jgi:hypothetical protein
MNAHSNDRYITFKATAIGPLYMRESNPTEPANYTGSYTRVRKRIVDTEIAMQRSSRTKVTTAMQTLSLLKLKVSQEQEEGGGLGS